MKMMRICFSSLLVIVSLLFVGVFLVFRCVSLCFVVFSRLFVVVRVFLLAFLCFPYGFLVVNVFLGLVVSVF